MYKMYQLALLAALMLPGGNIFAQQNKNALSIGDTVKGNAWKMIATPGKKLYILDFWSTGCVSCIMAFPKMEKLKKEFQNDLEIFLVNSYESEEQINKRMSTLNANRIKNGSKPIHIPDLPKIHGDSILKQLFPHVGVPHHVWLDSMGKVLFITHGNNATPYHVKTALEGKEMTLAVKKDLKAEGYDAWKQGLIQAGHPDLKPVFYSGFISYTSGMGGGNSEVTDSVNGMFRRSWMNTTILSLYKSASYKMVSKPRVLVDSILKEKFLFPKDANTLDEWRKDHIFSYEMVLPVEDKEMIGEILLSDLNRLCRNKFAIEGVIEKRKIPAYIVVINKADKIKFSNQVRQTKRTNEKISWINTPVFHIGNTIRAQFEDIDKGIVIINDIKYDNPLSADMEIPVAIKDMQDLKKQLNKYGLDLKKEEREIEFLVVREIK